MKKILSSFLLSLAGLAGIFYKGISTKNDNDENIFLIMWIASSLAVLFFAWRGDGNRSVRIVTTSITVLLHLIFWSSALYFLYGNHPD